jgi:predicted phosphodiesterase
VSIPAISTKQGSVIWTLFYFNDIWIAVQLNARMKIPLKIAVLSDAHGVFPALEAVWQDAQPFQPDMVLFAGDFTRGPYPAEVIQLLKSINAHMILGNDDINLIRFFNREVPDTWQEAKQFGQARWTIKQLSPENLRFLQSLPAQLSISIGDHQRIRIVHGSTQGAADSINPDYRPGHFERIIDSIDETCSYAVILTGSGCDATIGRLL